MMPTTISTPLLPADLSARKETQAAQVFENIGAALDRRARSDTPYLVKATAFAALLLVVVAPAPNCFGAAASVTPKLPPQTEPLLERFLAGPMAGVEEIVFAVRKV